MCNMLMCIDVHMLMCTLICNVLMCSVGPPFLAASRLSGRLVPLRDSSLRPESNGSKQHKRALPRADAQFAGKAQAVQQARRPIDTRHGFVSLFLSHLSAMPNLFSLRERHGSR